MIHRLLKIKPLRFALVFLTFAIIVSVMIVLTIDLLWDGKLNAELQFAGVLTPFLDAMLLVIFTTAMLNELRAEITRRKTAEQILNEAQRIARIGNWTLELATDKLTWSEEIFRIFEIDPEHFAASYTAFTEAIHPEDRERVNETYQNALQNKLAYSVTHRLLMKDGRIKHVTERAETIYDAAGEPLRSIGTVQDITEVKRLEQKLQAQEAIFRGLFENMSNAVALYDAVDNGEDFIFRNLNHAGELIENIECERIIGRRVTDIFPKIKEFGLLTVFQRVWKTGIPEHFPVAFYSDERVSGWRENSVFRLPSGELVAIYDDVTERKQIEHALEDSRDNLQLLLDSIAEGAYGVDNDGNCTFVNRAFLRLLGYRNPNDIIGRNVHKLIHHTRPTGEPYPESECRIYNAFRSLQQINMTDEVFWCKDGSPIPVELWSYPIFKNGGVIGAIVTFIDITTRKKAEEEIHNLAFYDALTHLANRRLLNDRLNQALAASKRSGFYGAVLFLDLDNFKPLNDTHGHDAGDLLLIEVGRRIKSCVREVDSVARFGGDEFVAMIRDLDIDQAMAAKKAGIIAEKIRVLLAEPYLITVQQEENTKNQVTHHCTASIGVVVFNSKMDQDDILKWADMAMYKAKEAGRNLICFHET